MNYNYTSENNVVDIEIDELGSDGRVYGEKRTLHNRTIRGGCITTRLETTRYCDCQELYDLFHDDNGVELEDFPTIRVLFDLDISHEPETHGSSSGDTPEFNSREVTVTGVEVVELRWSPHGPAARLPLVAAPRSIEEVVVKTFDGDSDVAGAIYGLFESVFEEFEPEEPEADHPRI